MPGDPFRKVVGGSPFDPSAQAWNAFIDSALAHKNRTTGNHSLPSSGAGRSPGIVMVELPYEEYGAGYDRFAILVPDDILFSQEDNANEFYNNPCLKVVEPDADRLDMALIIQSPGKNTGVGDGIVPAMGVGITPCKVDILDADHKFATAKAGEDEYLESAESGSIQILYKAGDSGVQWCIVRLGGIGGSAKWKADP